MSETGAKCGSAKLIPAAIVIDRGDNNDEGEMNVAVDEKPIAPIRQTAPALVGPGRRRRQRRRRRV